MVSATSQKRRLTNQQLAAALSEVADLLNAQGANPYRVRAYRRAAETLCGLTTTAHQLLRQEGIGGLTRLPGIGRSLAHAISLLDRTGRLPILERLRGDNGVERVFATVPDIGAGLAHRIHEQLGIETLAELEQAANDGRLAAVPGMGRKRIRAVRESLAGRYGHRRRPYRVVPRTAEQAIPVAELLSVDQQYRRQSDRDALPRVAPRRFNPFHQGWLPVLHTARANRRYTAMFSNTAHAHEMGTTHDWVVIGHDGSHDRWTVITALYGPLRGRRIVRGREHECKLFYENATLKQPATRMQASPSKGT